MKNIRKIDKELLEVVSLGMEKKVDCIAYVTDFEKARNFFNKKEIVSELPFINAIGLRLTPKGVIEICNHSWIKAITRQASVMALMNVSRQILGVEDNHRETGTIAYIDTGIMPHLDFTLGKNRIAHFVDLIGEYKQPYDDNGHGTFVAGAGSGNGAMSNGKYAGIAPNSNIISIKALNGNGEASAIKILEAMQWVYDNYKRYNIKVVCMSFGSEPLGINDPIMKGAETLWSAGIVMVAAAGNSGPEFETIKSPGVSSRIITVGGLDDNRIDDTYSPELFEVAEFSSRGPAMRRYKPDLIAPAVDIVSCSIKKGQPYTKLSGTSVATPMIAGMCSIIMENNPKLKPDQVKNQILFTCKGITFNRNLEGLGVPTKI